MVPELFSDGDLQASLQQEFSGAAAVVDAVDAEVLLDHTDEEVVAELLHDRAVPALDIAWEQAWSPGPRETRLDVQHDWQYDGAGEGRPPACRSSCVRPVPQPPTQCRCTGPGCT